MTNSTPHFETLAIHAGQDPDPQTGAVAVPIYQTSTFAQEEVGKHKGYEYARTANPTRRALETCLAALEAGTDALAFSSGMSAIDTILRLLNPGDHVIAANDVYGGTYRLFTRILSRYGLQFEYVDVTKPAQVEAAIRLQTRLIWLETPTNPLLKLADIDAISRIAHAEGRHIWVAVDNTFASPYLQQPLTLGADFVVHSTTKYIGGHSDVVGGAIIIQDAALWEQLHFLQNAIGPVPGPQDSWLTLRGIKTLALRMEAHGSNALAVAQFLDDHPAVSEVIYPYLDSHPQYDLARRQMRNGGGMLSFLLHGGVDHARQVVARTKLFTLAESLGGVESLIELPAAMTHASVANSPLQVDAGLIRASVGIEHVDDLIGDLAQALG